LEDRLLSRETGSKPDDRPEIFRQARNPEDRLETRKIGSRRWGPGLARLRTLGRRGALFSFLLSFFGRPACLSSFFFRSPARLPSDTPSPCPRSGAPYYHPSQLQLSALPITEPSLQCQHKARTALRRRWGLTRKGSGFALDFFMVGGLGKVAGQAGLSSG